MKKIGLIDKAFLLKRTPLFSSLDLDLILAAADKLGLSLYDPGEVIFAQGEEAHKMFFIARGAVNLIANDLTVSLAPLDFFGDEALFNEKPRMYEARAASETALLTMTRTNLLTIISECPSVAVGLLQVYSAKGRHFP
jgi:CRP-like cAMP-binding protein